MSLNGELTNGKHTQNGKEGSSRMIKFCKMKENSN